MCELPLRLCPTLGTLEGFGLSRRSQRTIVLPIGGLMTIPHHIPPLESYPCFDPDTSAFVSKKKVSKIACETPQKINHPKLMEYQWNVVNIFESCCPPFLLPMAIIPVSELCFLLCPTNETSLENSGFMINITLSLARPLVPPLVFVSKPECVGQNLLIPNFLQYARFNQPHFSFFNMVSPQLSSVQNSLCHSILYWLVKKGVPHSWIMIILTK